MKQANNNFLNLFVGISLILAFVIRFRNTSLLYYSESNLYNTYEYSEFLINFQGGFVRRGLFGELLYQLFSIVHYSVIHLVTEICYLAFFFVLIYFFYKFYKRKFCWWILLSPLFLGFTCYIVRKDYLLYCILIGCLYLLHQSAPMVYKRLFACLLLTLGLFMHEAFIFWGFPIYAIILLSKNHGTLLNWILVCIPLAVFVLLSFFKGNSEIAHGIVDSWNLVIPEKPAIYALKNSVGALSWDIQDTFLLHWNHNINTSNGGYGIILLPLYMLAGYYLFTTFLYVFDKQSVEEKKKGRLVISLVYSLTIICMIPMFTVLSCDTGRNFQYISVVSFAAFLIIPSQVIVSSFPKWYKKVIIKINKLIDRIIPPGRSKMIIMLLFIGMSPFYFSINSCLSHSVIGTLCYTIIKHFV